MADAKKLTPEVIETVCRYVRAGSFRETACAAAGITSRTLRNWLRRAAEAYAKGEHDEFTDFVEKMDEAESQGELRLVATIVKASADDWKAAAWMLEHRGGRRWRWETKGDPSVEDVDAQPVVNVHVKPAA